GIVRGDMNVVLTTGAWMAGLAVIGLAGGMGCTVFAILAGQSFGADLRGTLFRRVQTLSFANLDRLETGALITRLTSDVTQVQELVMMVLRVMVRAPLLLVGSLLMAVLTSPQLALLFLALIPIVLVILRWVIVRAYPLFGQVQRRLDTLTTVMQENLAGVRVVKAFARTTHEAGRFRHANDALMDRNVAAVQVNAATMPLMMLTLNAGVVGAVWIGGVRVSAGSLQVGELIAFINYLMQTLMALMTVSMLVMRVSRAEASADRIEGVLTSEPAVKTAPDALTTFAPRGRVAFEDVTFSYSGDDHDPALAGISFVAEPGQTVAILGATGAGKSSLVNLIPRFYDVTAGRVTLDGVDVRAIDEVALHAAVGVALQESILFSGAIRDNIRYGRPEATEAEVIAAARVAQAHDFIMRLPMGYGAVVGQRGVNLSGGQKQRLAIARALLTWPAVLIFDDSTSAVDVATEARIQTALAELGQQQTRFIVAQRISTVLTADKILVLDNGRLVAAGTHNELLATNPLYREIYDSQLESGTVAHGAA
ncbi:MAG: ABC transporter ATP-binding protein, partial [Thermomicrobiales bacterium]